MKKHMMALALLMMVMLPAAAEEKMHPGAVAERDKFYNTEMRSYGFSQKDISAVRQAGYSPFFSYLLLATAAETKQPAETILSLRAEGYSIKDICDRFNVDYEKMYFAYKNAAMAKDQRFPHESPGEGRKDVTTGPHPKDKGGKTK